MKKILLLGIITVILCVYLLSGCFQWHEYYEDLPPDPPTDWYPPQKLPDYDEAKAGAKILRKIDLSGGFSSYSDNDPLLFLAKNNDKAYFVARNFFYEYEIPVSNEDQKKYAKYFILNINSLFDSTSDRYYFDAVRSVTLVENYLYVRGTYYSKSNNTSRSDSVNNSIFIMKPDGSELKLLSANDLFGIDLQYSANLYYNFDRRKIYICDANEYDWRASKTVSPKLFVYNYDTSNDAFTLDMTADVVRKRDETDSAVISSIGYITDNHLWLSNYSVGRHSRYIYLNDLEMRSLENHNKIEKKIDLLYLQFDERPIAVIEYDGYVWVEITRYERQISKYYLLQLELNE